MKPVAKINNYHNLVLSFMCAEYKINVLNIRELECVEPNIIIAHKSHKIQ